jgi:hypothetical protein
MDVKESAAFEMFKLYILKDKGGAGSKTTSNGYAGKMRSFLQHCRNQRGIRTAFFKTLLKVGTSADPKDFYPPPDVEPFLESCVSDWVRKYSICAYIKLVRWLKEDLLFGAMLDLPPEEYHRRNWCLDSILHSSDMVLRALNKRGGRASNSSQATASANALDSPTLTELESLVVAYKTSPVRCELIEASQNGVLFLSRGVTVCGRKERSPYFMRNFLTLELLIFNGSRPGAIYNATLAEFEASRPLRSGVGYFLTVCRHKTIKTSGTDALILKPWLYQALQQYVRHIRPLVLPKEQDCDDLSQPLFPSSRTGISNVCSGKRSIKDSLRIFFELANKPIDPRICATSFRSFHASLGQLSSDPAIRSELPALMGHSQKTAVSTYFRDEAKAERRSTFQETLLTQSGAITPPRGCDDSAEQSSGSQLCNGVSGVQGILEKLQPCLLSLDADGSYNLTLPSSRELCITNQGEDKTILRDEMSIC